MKIYKVKHDDVLLPKYVVDALTELDWVESDKETISFHADDLFMILHGTRGTTSYSGPGLVRYGSNTTCYQIFSPKLPINHLYLGDGGSGVLEIDSVITAKLREKGVNVFDPSTSAEEVSKVISTVVNTYTHYHFDHLHFGAPLAAIFHANCIEKKIIGGDDPKARFRSTFHRPDFPREFGEMQTAYQFFDVPDPRSAVILFLPDGDFKYITSSQLEQLLHTPKAQVKHHEKHFALAECIVVRCFPATHPDPCISYRYESYDENNQLSTSATFMTDHEITESDYDPKNKYFRQHVKGSQFIYIDGQYDEKTYVPGFGHGRVELVGKATKALELPNVAIGHHDPTRKDADIDSMIDTAIKHCEDKKYRIVGASDRMMVFLPAKTRARSGIVFGRMQIELGAKVKDQLGPQNGLTSDYRLIDFTENYKIQDFTKKAS